MKKLSFILSFLIITVSSFSMTIGPIYFNQRIDGNGGYQEYEISNDTFSTQRYKIKVVPDTTDKKLAQEMEKWIEVYPRILTIPPQSTGKVKLLIKSSPSAKVGEYKFILAPTPIRVPVLEDKKSDSKLAMISGITVSLHFSMVLNGYVGYLGDIHKDLKIEKINSKDGIKVKIVNNLKREVALDILITDNETSYRDLLKIQAGKSLDKLYKGAKKIEIKEAPTEIELTTLY